MTKSKNSTKYGTRTYWRECGRRLLATRSALNISESEAAATYGVTPRTYRKYEQGSPQRGSGCLAFSKRYDISLDWLMRGAANSRLDDCLSSHDTSRCRDVQRCGPISLTGAAPRKLRAAICFRCSFFLRLDNEPANSQHNEHHEYVESD